MAAYNDYNGSQNLDSQPSSSGGFKHEITLMQILTILKDENDVKIDLRNMYLDKQTGEVKPT